MWPSDSRSPSIHQVTGYLDWERVLVAEYLLLLFRLWREWQLLHNFKTFRAQS